MLIANIICIQNGEVFFLSSHKEIFCDNTYVLNASQVAARNWQ